MAGPAIRYWEFAKTLAPYHQVTLTVPNKTDLMHDAFTILNRQEQRCRDLVRDHDVILTQVIPHNMAFWTDYYGTPLIIDAYDPIPLETLEIEKQQSLGQRNKTQIGAEQLILSSFARGTQFLCACERQRDLWIGLMLAQGALRPTLYDQDPSLRKTIHIVPFGLPVTTPAKTGMGPRERFGLKKTDKLLLWGGGIWNWFDPLTAIKAIHKLSKKRSDLFLLFMGMAPPDSATPTMQAAHDAIALAKELGLFQNQVLFNFDWVPYEERHNYLLDATAAISTHFSHLETQFAFRTRFLDCLWMGLPIIASEGDCLSDLINRHQLGTTVPCQNIEALAESIEALIDNPERLAQAKRQCHEVGKQFTWEKATAPLHIAIERACAAPSKPCSLPKALWNIGWLKTKIRSAQLCALLNIT